MIVGNGGDTITVGSGWYNDVSLGNGTDNVTIQGSHDDINGGAGNETIYLGLGHIQLLQRAGAPHQRLPPAGTAVELPRHDGAYYHDSITNCTVVSP